jgi:uncharacterized protein YjbJ (UPF0337 family)
VDKVKGKYDQAAGKIKEKTGDVLDDHEMEAEGKAQQVKGHVKETIGKIKDALDK